MNMINVIFFNDLPNLNYSYMIIRLTDF